MILAIFIIAVVAAIEAGLLYGGWWLHGEQRREIERMWQRIEGLEDDKRALTESLCRAQGKPYIGGKNVTIPSDGWFDGKPHLEVKTK